MNMQLQLACSQYAWVSAHLLSSNYMHVFMQGHTYIHMHAMQLIDDHDALAMYVYTCSWCMTCQHSMCCTEQESPPNSFYTITNLKEEQYYNIHSYIHELTKCYNSNSST